MSKYYVTFIAKISIPVSADEPRNAEMRALGQVGSMVEDEGGNVKLLDFISMEPIEPLNIREDR